MSAYFRMTLLAVAFLVVPATGAPAQEPAVESGVYEKESAENRKVREIAKDLRCAVCQNESVADSNSQLARNMRQLIREQLQQGKSPDEVRAYFVSRYGDYILMEPRKTGYNLFLWAFPFAALLIGAIIVTLRFVKRREDGAGDEPLPPADYAKTDDLIRRLKETDGDNEDTEKKA